MRCERANRPTWRGVKRAEIEEGISLELSRRIEFFKRLGEGGSERTSASYTLQIRRIGEIC